MKNLLIYCSALGFSLVGCGGTSELAANQAVSAHQIVQTCPILNGNYSNGTDSYLIETRAIDGTFSYSFGKENDWVQAGADGFSTSDGINYSKITCGLNSFTLDQKSNGQETYKIFHDLGDDLISITTPTNTEILAKQSEPIPGTKSILRYTSLGDSITAGADTSHPCQATKPIDVESACPDGTSWADRLAQSLAADRPVLYQNLGVGGFRASNILNDSLPQIQPDVDLVTLYVGTADSVDCSRMFNSTGNYDACFQKTKLDYDKIVATLRQRYPRAQIVLLNTLNTAFLDYFVNVKGVLSGEFSQSIDRFIINSYSDSGLIVVDMVCDPSFYDPARISAGGHPTDEGSKLIAVKTQQAMREGTKPKNICEPYLK